MLSKLWVWWKDVPESKEIKKRGGESTLKQKPKKVDCNLRLVKQKNPWWHQGRFPPELNSMNTLLQSVIDWIRDDTSPLGIFCLFPGRSSDVRASVIQLLSPSIWKLSGPSDPLNDIVKKNTYHENGSYGTDGQKKLLADEVDKIFIKHYKNKKKRPEWLKLYQDNK